MKINLPMIAAGDTLYLQAAYARGATAYVDTGFPATFTGQAFGVQGTTFASYDAVVGPSGHMTLTPTYSGLISIEHYWTPTIRQGIFAGALHVNYSGAIRTAAAIAQGAACPTCVGTVPFAGPFGPSLYNPFNPNYDGGTQINVGTNLIWSPIKDLDIGVEVMYTRNQMQHSEYDANQGVGKITSNGQFFEYRLRIQRDF